MRYLKVMTAVGMLLAVSGIAGAVGIPFTHPWGTGADTAIFAHLTDYDVVSQYTGKFVTGANVPVGVALNPNGGLASDGLSYPALVKNAGNGALAGEDGWGIFQIDTIFEGRVPNPILAHNNITQDNAANPLFAAGFQGKELVGIFHGRTDVGVTFFSDGSMKMESIGDNYEIYLQDVGTFDDGDAGSAGRIAAGKYISAGFDAVGNQIGELVLSGKSTAGFLGSPQVPGAQIVSQFIPSGTLPGNADLYINLLATGNVGTDNAEYNNDYFIGISDPDARADLRLHVTTTVNNPVNLSPEIVGAFDWTLTSSDPMTGNTIIPEPTTMLGVLLAVSGLARYMRGRKA